MKTFFVIATVAVVAPLLINVVAAKTGSSNRETAPPPTIQSSPKAGGVSAVEMWGDVLCTVADHVATDKPGKESSQNLTYGFPADLAAYDHKGSFDLIAIPHFKKGGQFTCDLKLGDYRDDMIPPSIRVQLDLPVIETYSPDTDKKTYVVADTVNHGLTVFKTEAEIKANPTDTIYEITMHPNPGKYENVHFWDDHMVGGPEDTDVVGTTPVTLTYEFTVTQNGQEIQRDVADGSNTKFATFNFTRPDAIRMEFDLTPSKEKDQPVSTRLRAYAFRQVRRPHDPASNRYSLSSMGTSLRKESGNEWSMSQSAAAESYSFGSPSAGKDDYVYRIRVTESGRP